MRNKPLRFIDLMPTREQIVEAIESGIDAAEGNIHAINCVMLTQILQTNLDIRDLLQSIDRRIAAQSITKKEK